MGAKVKEAGGYLESRLRQMKAPGIVEVRGRGMMWGVELSHPAGELLADLLKAGLIMLADGKDGNVLAFTPPFSIAPPEIDFSCEVIERLLLRG